MAETKQSSVKHSLAGKRLIGAMREVQALEFAAAYGKSVSALGFLRRSSHGGSGSV
jgi:hypothetical protein